MSTILPGLDAPPVTSPSSHPTSSTRLASESASQAGEEAGGSNITEGSERFEACQPAAQRMPEDVQDRIFEHLCLPYFKFDPDRNPVNRFELAVSEDSLTLRSTSLGKELLSVPVTPRAAFTDTCPTKSLPIVQSRVPEILTPIRLPLRCARGPQSRFSFVAGRNA